VPSVRERRANVTDARHSDVTMEMAQSGMMKTAMPDRNRTAACGRLDRRDRRAKRKGGRERGGDNSAEHHPLPVASPAASAPILARGRARAPADWARLQEAVIAANFWALDPTGEQRGLDGACWTIEGRRKDVFRAVHRWSPHGAIHALGRLLFAFAGQPLAGAKLY